MQKRSLFQIVFGKKENKTYGQTLQFLNGYNASFTNFNKNLYDTAQIRICIDAIARNGAKLNPKHIKQTPEHFSSENSYIRRILAEQPNEIDNAYSFYYKVISQLYLNNNVFIYIKRDGNVVHGLYPLLPSQYKLLEYNGGIYVQFTFNGGQTYTASLKDDIIHLKRFYCENDILGSGQDSIIKTMSIHHMIREGIINAIKTTSAIKGYLKTTKAMLKPEDIKRTRDAFVTDFINASDGSNIAGLDATTDFMPINLSPVTASDGQLKEINDEIKNYFGLSDSIIQSSYNEDQWNAFYESTLEPIALMMSLEFTNKLFSLRERQFGNKIVFEANRLEYASNSTKINIARYMNNYMTINEIREVFNLIPVANGDKIMQDLNHINSQIADIYQSKDVDTGDVELVELIDEKEVTGDEGTQNG